MQSVAIFPVLDASGEPAYRAVAQTGQSEGRTVGEALDGLSATLESDNGGTIVLIQPFRADALFTAQQRDRLQELMSQWRVTRDDGRSLPEEQQSELQSLIDAELHAADARTQEILRRLEE